MTNIRGSRRTRVRELLEWLLLAAQEALQRPGAEAKPEPQVAEQEQLLQEPKGLVEPGQFESGDTMQLARTPPAVPRSRL